MFVLYLNLLEFCNGQQVAKKECEEKRDRNTFICGEDPPNYTEKIKIILRPLAHGHFIQRKNINIFSSTSYNILHYILMLNIYLYKCIYIVLYMYRYIVLVAFISSFLYKCIF